MNTRYDDLAKLEQDRDKRGYESKHAHKFIERIHRQTKDSTLESMRRALRDAHKRNDLSLIYQLEKRIQEYARQHRL